MNCPDREQLLAYLRNEAEADLARHVEACHACQAALEQMSTLDEAQQQKLRHAAALASVEVPPTLEPRRLGNFELLHPLGAPSGQGEVWLARHLLLKCLCAVKMLRPDRQGREALARFMREMELYADFDHPNIVGIRHAEEVEGQPILVMKYIDGFSLHELVQRHGPLTVADACELARQAALGLQYAHEKKVVHRDIKPGNLMLDRRVRSLCCA